MKVTKTYSIEESLYNTFDSITSEKNINKSSFFEDAIKKYIKDNDLDTINKQYVSKSDPNNIVTVINQDQTYYILDDGSKIQRILFLHLFKPFSGVDPNKFFNDNNVIDNIIEQIKDIDTSNIVDYSSPNVLTHKILDYKTLGVFNLSKSDKKSFEEKEEEKEEKENDEINKVDPNIFFKENTIIKDIADIIKNNMIIKNIEEQNVETDDLIKESYNEEKILDKEEILKKYYDEYLIGGFITKTKSELIEIITNINKCGDYFKEKSELLNIIRNLLLSEHHEYYCHF